MMKIFRNTNDGRHSRRKTKKDCDASVLRIEACIRSMLNLTSYDCLLAVAIVGIIFRMLMLVIYPIASVWVEFDSSIGVGGYIGKIFWIYFDVSFIRIWRESVRTQITGGHPGVVKQYAITTVRVIVALLSAVTLCFAIARGRLQLFFTINRLLVMGSCWTLVILLVYRMWRVSRAIENGAMSAQSSEHVKEYTNSKVFWS